MADRALDELHSDLLPLCNEFIAQCQSVGIRVIITETYRSDEEPGLRLCPGSHPAGQDHHQRQGRPEPAQLRPRGWNSRRQGFDFAIENGDGTLDWNASDRPGGRQSRSVKVWVSYPAAHSTRSAIARTWK